MPKKNYPPKDLIEVIRNKALSSYYNDLYLVLDEGNGIIDWCTLSDIYDKKIDINNKRIFEEKNGIEVFIDNIRSTANIK